MTTTILRNHSWLGDDNLDLSKLSVASFMLFRQYLFLTWCDYSKCSVRLTKENDYG
jgi:hypothetical protein